jgi:predicted site-specific integrase-resolvase
MFRVGLYARVSTHDQQTLSLQMRVCGKAWLDNRSSD